MDFDPRETSYQALLDEFWADHDPTARAYSRQYRSLILTVGDGQAAEARASAEGLAKRLGEEIRTEIRPLDRFYAAEDYHQKYALRCQGALVREVKKFFPSEEALRESTLAMRLNAWCGGDLDEKNLAGALERAGLDRADAARIAALAGATPPEGGPACGVGGH